MSKVVSMGQTCAFFVSRAARHRRAGRYDEAMALLTKARDQFGPDEEIELEAAQIYDEIGCEEEAARAYLRVVRQGGRHKALALFHLALGSAQRGDIRRAEAYYQQFAALRQSEVPQEMAQLLSRQLQSELGQRAGSGRRARARQLRRRAVARLQEGKIAAAERTLRHALALRRTASSYTLLACCLLMEGKLREAVECACAAHKLSPRRVQTLCVMADAYAALGELDNARRALHLAALRAASPEDLAASAMESAKRGEDRLTLRLTQSLLRREPYNTQGMLLRASALMNLGRLKEASRLFGRLCGLMPENTVCEAYFRITRDGHSPGERVSLGLDVPREEGVRRAMELLSLLYAQPQSLREDRAALRSACRLCAWAIRSPMAGAHVKTAALILLCALEIPAADQVLMDALTDPQVDDAFKAAALQALTAQRGFQPYDVDYGGRLVRLAAGASSSRPVGEVTQRIVQRVADALSPGFPDAARMLLPLFLAYLERYGAPGGRQEAACAAALEYTYHHSAGHRIRLHAVARRYGAPERLCAVIARRLKRLSQPAAYGESEHDGGESHELH